MTSPLGNVRNISRFKKEKFLKEMSEDEFRDAVIRPLFFRLGYADGRDLCGPMEKGKDAIFKETDKLGMENYIAVQTKKGNLNMARTASTNVVEAITQLRTAIETSVPLTESRKKVYPSKVYLCASGKINESAKNHILDTISDVRVLFLDSDDLIPKLDDHFPELWLGIDTDIFPYYRAILQFVEGEYSSAAGECPLRGAILTGAAADKNFIQLTLFKSTLKTRKHHGQIERIPDFEEIDISKVLSRKHSRLLILGDAGSGKSTTLLRLAYLTARRGIESHEGYVIPVLLRATDLVNGGAANLVEAADQRARAFARIDGACFSSKDLREGRVAILVDALDEVADQGKREHVVDLANRFSSDYPRCKVVFTSRPYTFIRDIDSLAGYESFNIQPIGWKEAEKIVKALKSSGQVPEQQTQETLRRLEQVHGMELNPLLITVFAATAEYSRQDVPANITELFKKFTELMLGRWDENKGLSQQYQAPLKDFLLCKIAFHMHRQESTKISASEFGQLVRHELDLRGYSADLNQIEDEILNRSGLFRNVGEMIEFRHHLLQEFFAGRGISSIDFIKGHISEDWWKRPIVFYFGENPGDIGRLQDVMRSIEQAAGGDLLEAASTVGLALQACYLSAVEEKLEVWEWVASALSVTREIAIASIDADGKRPLTSFVHYYLYGRDSVALSNIKSHVDRLERWADESAFGNSAEKDAKLFWLIAALIETGAIDLAQRFVSHYQPVDMRYLLAIHLGCYLTKEIRMATRQEKQDAEDVCRRLEEKIMPLRVQLMEEIGSQLLEMRKGEIAALPHTDANCPGKKD